MRARGRMLVRIAVLALAAGALLPGRDASAHCDSMDGPVVAAARVALEKGDPAPVLRWVARDGEAEVKDALRSALAARKASPEARGVADRWFFETVVRVHRAGEGEPFTGLKPAGSPVDPGVREADAALESGSVDDLAKALAGAVESGVRARFAKAVEARKRSEASVEAGREYVARYVEFVRYVERLHADAAGGAGEHGGEERK